MLALKDLWLGAMEDVRRLPGILHCRPSREPGQTQLRRRNRPLRAVPHFLRSAKTLYLGQSSPTGLAAGASTELRFNKSSSTTLFSGKYLLAIIDSDSQVKESNETNNKAVRVIP
jgi:hypothetical protein